MCTFLFRVAFGWHSSLPPPPPAPQPQIYFRPNLSRRSSLLQRPASVIGSASEQSPALADEYYFLGKSGLALAVKHKDEPTKWQDGPAGGSLEDRHPRCGAGNRVPPHGSPFPAEACWLPGLSSKSQDRDKLSETNLLQVSNTIHASWSLFFLVHFILRLKLLNLNVNLQLAWAIYLPNWPYTCIVLSLKIRQKSDPFHVLGSKNVLSPFWPDWESNWHETD